MPKKENIHNDLQAGQRDDRPNLPTVGQASRLSNTPKRRNLPHYEESGGYYFITFATYRRKPLTESDKECVFKALHYLKDKKYDLQAAVVMDDHVHLVIKPSEPLAKIMHSIKSFTAHQMNKAAGLSGSVWQDEYHDRVIRNDREYREKMLYIANNPIKSNPGSTHSDYRWLYVKGWINGG